MTHWTTERLRRRLAALELEDLDKTPAARDIRRELARRNKAATPGAVLDAATLDLAKLPTKWA